MNKNKSKTLKKYWKTKDYCHINLKNRDYKPKFLYFKPIKLKKIKIGGQAYFFINSKDYGLHVRGFPIHLILMNSTPFYGHMDWTLQVPKAPVKVSNWSIFFIQIIHMVVDHKRRKRKTEFRWLEFRLRMWKFTAIYFHYTSTLCIWSF